MTARKIKVRIANYGDDCIMQTYVQPNGIMYRIFVPMTENEWGNNEFIEESQLWTNDNLKTKNFMYKDKQYGCTYNLFCNINPNLAEPYNEVMAVITQSALYDRTRNDRMFFTNRLGDTYFNKVRAGDWAKMIRVFGCRWLYRFMIQPNTDITTCPCLALETRIFLTNIEFDEEYVIDTMDWKGIIHPWINSCRPVVKIEGPDTIPENGYADYILRVYNSDGSVNTDDYTYLIDCKQGYAPNKEVAVKQGVGTFRIMAFGLNAGTNLRFKINDKVWTSYAEKTVLVVNAS